VSEEKKEEVKQVLAVLEWNLEPLFTEIAKLMAQGYNTTIRIDLRRLRLQVLATK
jgi:hypothetical protein